ncbi:hypothetical protein [Patulibacter defluvii]|uniref:hypothetical protein n=1 Tax=Patulibacter defluvii TaxID=3095358 RepID=UPI002A7525EA|nr:hypothetical protein [Patulibacter sp. DM4]
MPQPPSNPGPDELLELAALADGSLDPARRPALEQRIARSPELQAAFERQRRALTAAAALRYEPLPEALRATVAAQAAARRAPSRPRRRLLPVGAAAALVAAVVAVVLAVGGSTADPAVADVARVAARAVPGPPPAARPGGELLDVAAGGIDFPDWSRLGWRARGVSRTTVDGRRVTTVAYGRGRARIGYAIVDEQALDEPRGTVVRRQGIAYRGLRVDGRSTVTWRRAGRTCVLTGEADVAELLRLASWRDGGALAY